MNARQKAKKLKKELDYIKSQPLRDVYRVINVEAEHLRAYRIFPLIEVEKLGEEVIEDEARHQLSIEFLKFIRENMIVNKDRDLDGFHSMKYSTDIWISFGRK
jgi:hypothetical protein